MCPPTYFTVDYSINPWMRPGEASRDIAQAQWDNLVAAIEKQAGAKVVTMPAEEGLPDLVFTANAAFVYQNTAIVANYRFPERQGETPHCVEWFTKNGYKTIVLPEDQSFEGAGDALIWQDRVFSGYKTRTDIITHNEITKHTGLPVLSLELGLEAFYHIDVCICPLATGDFIYYPEAFDSYGQQVIEANIPERNRIPVTKEDAERFACNAVNVGDTVILNQGSQTLVDTLKDRGLKVVEVDVSEFLKAGGSTKCLTLKIA